MRLSLAGGCEDFVTFDATLSTRASRSPVYAPKVTMLSARESTVAWQGAWGSERPGLRELPAGPYRAALPDGRSTTCV